MLQEKIQDLEQKQKQLLSTVAALEEREAELEKLVETKDSLLQEVHHRVKNNLQIITSLLSLGSDAAGPSELLQFKKTKTRIDAISLIYQHFLFSGNYQEVTLCALLRAVAGEIKSDTGRNNVDLEFDFPADEIIIDVDSAVPLALIANEVIANSFKFAFGAGRGLLRLSLKHCIGADCGRCYKLIVADNGPGFSSAETAGGIETVGMVLIDVLTAQLEGQYSYDNSDAGTVFKLEFSAGC